jgi:hypothetical protein
MEKMIHMPGIVKRRTMKSSMGLLLFRVRCRHFFMINLNMDARMTNSNKKMNAMRGYLNALSGDIN